MGPNNRPKKKGKINMKKANVSKMVLLSFLLALVIVLQFLSPFIKIGVFSPTLSLIPIVVGAIILGWKEGSILGLAFGGVVLYNSVVGVDASGLILFNAHPIITSVVCLLKGLAAGLVPALVFNALKGKNNIVAIILATILSPIVNTGILCLAMPIFYLDILREWADGTNTVVFIFTGMIGLNFLVEFGINAVLSPVVSRVVQIYKLVGNR